MLARIVRTSSREGRGDGCVLQVVKQVRSRAREPTKQQTAVGKQLCGSRLGADVTQNETDKQTNGRSCAIGDVTVRKTAINSKPGHTGVKVTCRNVSCIIGTGAVMGE